MSNSPYADLGVYTRVDPALLAEHNRGIARARNRTVCPECGGEFKSLPGHARSGCGS